MHGLKNVRAWAEERTCIKKEEYTKAKTQAFKTQKIPNVERHLGFSIICLLRMIRHKITQLQELPPLQEPQQESPLLLLEPQRERSQERR